MSDSDLIVSLAMRKHAPREIAAQLGMDAVDVHQKLISARQQGAEIPQFEPGLWARNRPMVPISMEVWRALAPHAQIRGLTANELATLILETVMLADLVDAVLDDGAVCAPPPAPG